MAQTILDKILKTKRKEVLQLHQSGDLAQLQLRACDAPAVRDFFSALTCKPSGMMNLIAEVKKASPSAGVIREDFDPVQIARRYESAGANALSVLTDEEYFQGRLEYLGDIREAVSLPVLRKDFIIDDWQIYQSRAAGADAILLIASALNDEKLAQLAQLTGQLQMTALVEVHSFSELSRVRSVLGDEYWSCNLLGINNRDLATFNVDIDTTIVLAGQIGGDIPIVSESGIKDGNDVRRLAAAGVSAILVGQTLMQSQDVPARIAELT